jgi:hypothetical protein
MKHPGFTARMAGHENIVATQKSYAKVSPKMVAEAWAKRPD